MFVEFVKLSLQNKIEKNKTLQVKLGKEIYIGNLKKYKLSKITL